MFSIEKEIKKNKYRLDKDKNKIQLIGYVKKNTDYIYECEKCPNVAFYESELEDIAIGWRKSNANKLRLYQR